MSRRYLALAAAGLTLMGGLAGAEHWDGLPASALAASAAKSSDERWKEARWAIEYNQVEKVSRLLDAGLPINAQDQDGWTLLHVAAWKGDLKMVRYLIGRGADRSARNTKGQEPGQVTFDAQVRSVLGGQSSQPTSSYCTRMYHEATRLCDMGGSGSFCRTQAANKAQSCNKTGRW